MFAACRDHIRRAQFINLAVFIPQSTSTSTCCEYFPWSLSVVSGSHANVRVVINDQLSISGEWRSCVESCGTGQSNIITTML